MPTTTGIATEFITFSRTSNATITDSNGVIKWAPHNLLLASEQFDSASWSKTSTTPTANAVAAPNGTTTADTLTASGANGTTLQSYTSLGVSYTFGIWLKRKTGTGNIQIAADSGTYTTVTITSDWALYTVTQTPAAGTISAGIRIVTSADAVEAWGAHLYRSDLGGMKANTSAYPMYNPTTAKNLLGFTEDFTNGYWAPKYLLTVASNAALAPNGLQTADRITFTGQYAYISSAYPVTVTNSIATVSVWLKLESGNANIQLRGTSNSTVYLQNITVTSEWQRFSATFTHNGTDNIGLVIQDRNASGFGSVYAWGAQLSDSASLDTYVPNYGAAPTAAAYYGPRLDADPVTLAAKGLLVEESRANLLTYSDNFGSTGFPTATNIVVAENDTATTSPDGTTNADKLTDNATNDQHRLFDNYTFTAANAHTLSVYVKRDTHRWFRMLMSDGTTLFHANFDLLSGIVGQKSASVTSSNIIPLSNGWFRVSMTFTVVAALGNIQMVMLNSDSTSSAVSYVGTGTSLWLYGLQIEANASFATSYIPTGAATATRAADVASVSTQAFPYSASEGTLVVNASSPCIAAIANIITLDNGTTQERIRLLTDVASVKTIVTESNTTQANLSPGSATANTPFKFAVAYKVNDFAAVVNGSAAATYPTGNVPVVNIARLGADSSGNYLNGHIRQITYLPRRISNAELITRTA